MTGRLVDRAELAFWYRQSGNEPDFLQFDEQWAVADEQGTPVGTVFLDGDFFELPDYWMREADGTPAIGLGHADGLLASLTDPHHRVLWGDGSPVGLFRGTYAYWQDQAIAQWKVDIPWAGNTPTFQGAWLWDPSGAAVASVRHVESPGAGAYLALSRTAELDESLRWIVLAFPLVVAEQQRRARMQAQRLRHHRHRHRH